jgi:NAD(P)-dependent dehydrogenase (short-subunit alcohol dehydrogenase family)
MKTIFITGASSGIGLASAKLFQAKGWKVIATMRKPTPLENITVLPLDVTNITQIQSTVAQALAMGEIDVVLNNAGFGIIGPMEAYTPEQVQEVVNTNFLGTVNVTQAFISYFRERKSGLFINVTSMAGITGYPFTSIYNGTKWALEGWSESLAIELALFNIGVKTVLPSATKTNLYGSSSYRATHPAYDASLQKMLAGVNPASTAEQIADVVYEAATDKEDKMRYPAGIAAGDIYKRRYEIGPEAFRKEVTKWFLG